MSRQGTQLLPGEEIELAKLDVPVQNPMSDEQINEKYVKGDIRIVTEQARYPLPQIPSMLASGSYRINPEFQRRHRWDTEKKSGLIESFIMNVPVPPVFFYEDTYSHYEVMDGLQRLTAISDFYQDKFELSSLKEWPELNGRCYSSLPDQVRKGVDRRYLSSIILLQETAKSSDEAQLLKQMVFERINSGGVLLQAQESRNAIYNGPMNEMCIRLSRNVNLCKTWGIPTPDPEEERTGNPKDAVIQNELYRKMTDVELVLRFFAYRQRVSNQKGALSSFFNNYLKHANFLPKETLINLGNMFESTIDLAFELLGERAFWLLRKRENRWRWYARPTTAVYDPMMYTLSGLLQSRNSLLNRRKEITEELQIFYRDNYEDFEGRYTNLSNIQTRNQKFLEFFQRYT